MALSFPYNAAGRSGLLGMLVPVAGSSDKQTLDTELDFDTTMAAGELYIYTADQDSYILQGTTPTAAASDGSMLVPAGMPVLIDGGQGAKLSCIKKTTAGVATLQKMKVI